MKLLASFETRTSHFLKVDALSTLISVNRKSEKLGEGHGPIVFLAKVKSCTALDDGIRQYRVVDLVKGGSAVIGR